MNHTHTNHIIKPEMLTDAGISRLLAKHDQLEDQLADELKHAYVDWDGVKQLKRRKLALVEEVARLRRTRGIH
jgi:hypothetical protein